MEKVIFMHKIKNENMVVVVKNEEGKIVGYLTEEQEEKGYDIELDLQGFTVEAL